MRIAISFVGVAVVITAFGCQSKTENTTSGETVAEPQKISQVEPTSPTEKSDPESTAIKDAKPSESEEHQHGGRGMMGRGPGGMRGMGRGPAAMGGMRADMMTLHAMFASRDKIKRTITNLPDGAEVVTESDDEEIAGMLQEHVPAMEKRVLGNKPLPPMTFHPIFVELIKHSKDYALTYEATEKGMKVKYTSKDPYVVMLVQEHAKLVSRFIKNGMEEIHKPYKLPKLEKDSKESSAADSRPSDKTR